MILEVAKQHLFKKHIMISVFKNNKLKNSS
jgi:hypothetical protein